MKAGGIVGFLTGLCRIALGHGADFSRGSPIAALLSLSARELAILALLTAAGAGLGAIISSRTSNE